MGLTVESYTTEQGITITQLYLSIESFRFLRCLGSNNFSGTYQVAAYVSRADKYAGKSPIGLPNNLAYVEVLVAPEDFSTQTPFQIGYAKIRSVWEAAGYVVNDLFEDPYVPPTVTEPEPVVEPVVEPEEAPEAESAPKAAPDAESDATPADPNVSAPTW